MALFSLPQQMTGWPNPAVSVVARAKQLLFWSFHLMQLFNRLFSGFPFDAAFMQCKTSIQGLQWSLLRELTECCQRASEVVAMARLQTLQLLTINSLQGLAQQEHVHQSA
jgi:hypothetical protein